MEEYELAIRDISYFLPSEAVDWGHVERLAQEIAAAQCWTDPLPVDRDSGIVMDGNHRLQAATLLGLSRIPCVLVDYQDPRVSVLDWNSGGRFSVGEIFRTVENGLVLPYKTTRHSFAPTLPQTAIPLNELQHDADYAPYSGSIRLRVRKGEG